MWAGRTFLIARRTEFVSWHPEMPQEVEVPISLRLVFGNWHNIICMRAVSQATVEPKFWVLRFRSNQSLVCLEGDYIMGCAVDFL